MNGMMDGTRSGQEAVQYGIGRVIEGRNLERTEARSIMEAIMNGESTPAQI